MGEGNKKKDLSHREVRKKGRNLSLQGRE